MTTTINTEAEYEADCALEARSARMAALAVNEMMTEAQARVLILHRVTGSVVFTAEIDCNENTSRSIKLGLAVQAALKVGASLRGANLRGANLDGANLCGADLRGVSLRRSSLDAASLDAANLDWANLDGASLLGSSLRGASLRGANLDFANLDGANLDGASLDGASLDGAKWGFARPTAIVSRINDPCQFALWRSLWGGHAVKAGSHLYSISEHRAHVAREYAGTEKAAETLAILDYLDARLNAQAAAITAIDRELAPKLKDAERDAASADAEHFEAGRALRGAPA